jgi:predicted ATPase
VPRHPAHRSTSFTSINVLGKDMPTLGRGGAGDAGDLTHLTLGRGGAGDLSDLTQYEAVRLFIERAQAVKADFALTNVNAPAVAEICYRLDGLPLAIELAAARAKLFPPQALLARLDSRLKLLTGGARDLPARQQTIRNTIDWSYNLLDEDEKRLFTRLGVFAGGCTLEAAEAMCGSWGDGPASPTPISQLPTPTLDGLAALVDQSLIRQVEGVGGEPRFFMLETIREYALERLAEAGELGQAQERHLAYYLSLAERANSQRGIVFERWYERLAAEPNNLRAARLWSRTAASGAEAELQLVGALWWFYVTMGYASEARAWLEAALERRSGVAPAVQALALLGLGVLLSESGEYQQATKLYRESLALYQDIGDNAGVARLHEYLGYVAYLQGFYEQAQLNLELSLAYARSTGEMKGVIWDLLLLGDVFGDQGEERQATNCFQEALGHSQSLEDKEGQAWALVCLGRVAHRQGNDEQATALYHEGLALLHDLKYRYGIAQVLTDLGDVACALDKREEAMTRYQESLAGWQEIGAAYYAYNVYKTLQGMAGAAGMQGQAKWAARLFGAVEHLREVSGTPIALIDRAGYEHLVDATRVQLDEATFAAAWAEGRAMSLDQAIAEALGEGG